MVEDDMCEADEPGGGWSPRSAARACPSGPLPARRRCSPGPDSCRPPTVATPVCRTG